MGSDNYRKEIKAAIAHEEATGSLATLIETRLHADLGSDPNILPRTRELVAEIRGYVESSAELMDAALESAVAGGSAEHVRPIFETAQAYVSEEVDFIPDSLGLAGLVDDAYLVMGLIREMASRHRALTGSHLVPPEVFDGSNRIRKMIGEPTATRLDVAIIAFAREPNIRDTIEMILERTGEGGFPINIPAASSIKARDAVPDLQLGALGTSQN